ncbi:ABC transporter substrate-binding protein [Thermoflexus hugenholtzii]
MFLREGENSEIIGLRIYNPYVGWVNFVDCPERIVSLNPSVTETLYMLGAGDRVVGVSSWCHKPADALLKPKVGSYTMLLEDKLAELKPDLVLTTTGAQKSIVEKLVALGYPTYPIPYPKDLYSILTMVSEIGGLIYENDRALELCEELLSHIEKLRSLKNTRRSKPSVYVEIDLGGPTIPAYFNHITHALNLAGLNNIFQNVSQDYLYGMEVKGYEVIDVVETLRKFDPDFIVYESKNLHPSENEALEVLHSRGLSTLRAVVNRSILTLPADTLAHYGPSFIKEFVNVAEKIWNTMV